MNIHKNPNLLVNQLRKVNGVYGVSYEYPGIFHIDTDLGTICLGDSDDVWAWNGEDCAGFLEGETLAKTPAKIAQDFAEWLRG